jgi:hypothetical protein
LHTAGDPHISSIRVVKSNNGRGYRLPKKGLTIQQSRKRNAHKILLDVLEFLKSIFPRILRGVLRAECTPRNDDKLVRQEAFNKYLRSCENDRGQSKLSPGGVVVLVRKYEGVKKKYTTLITIVPVWLSLGLAKEIYNLGAYIVARTLIHPLSLVCVATTPHNSQIYLWSS